MKGYTIQNSIDLLEKAVGDGGSGGASTAADVSYDNTSSHLTADDVQAAIDELNTAISQIDTGDEYSETETKIGTWIDGSDLYRKVIHFNEALSVALNATWVSTGVTMSDVVMLTRLDCLDSTSTFVWNILSGFINSGVLTLTSVVNIGTGTAGVSDIVIEYTKAATQSTRKKKK